MIATATTLTPAELQAIEVHKYFLSLERGREVSIDEAIASFARAHAADWRRDKARRDATAQLEAMDARRLALSRELGRDVGRAEFASEWCARHAADWRRERESLELNGFVEASFAAAPAQEPLTVSVSALAQTLESYDCDVYVHGGGITSASFVLGARPFAHVKSVRCVPALQIAEDRPVVVLATGSHAGAAVGAVRELLGPLPIAASTPPTPLMH